MKVVLYGRGSIIRRFSASLAREGIEVIGVSDEPQALQSLKNKLFDLAVVDGLLEEAEEAWRLINRFWRVPVMIIVGGTSADWEEAGLLEANGYIPEVTSGPELAARIRAVVRRKGRGSLQIEGGGSV